MEDGSSQNGSSSLLAYGLGATTTTTWFERLMIATEAQAIAKTTLDVGIANREAIRPEQLLADGMTVSYADALDAKVWRRCSGLSAV
ncbi:hypothetical protein SAMN05446935_8544 [Burkholderia sp. YR290]|nr:hypothetical protein SAMN05446935_8544 [Burkholderia sp. YR290]